MTGACSRPTGRNEAPIVNRGRVEWGSEDAVDGTAKGCSRPRRLRPFLTGRAMNPFDTTRLFAEKVGDQREKRRDLARAMDRRSFLATLATAPLAAFALSALFPGVARAQSGTRLKSVLPATLAGPRCGSRSTTRPSRTPATTTIPSSCSCPRTIATRPTKASRPWCTCTATARRPSARWSRTSSASRSLTASRTRSSSFRSWPS